MSGKALLVLGATGKTGSRVLEVALERGWVTTAFVRNPAKLAEPVRSRLAAVVQGDLNDAAAVDAAVRSARPDAIVDASSALPLPTKGGAPKNSADRNIFYGAIARALAADGRIDRCVLICEGGQLVPEPGGKIHSWSVSCFAALVRLALGARKWGASPPAPTPRQAQLRRRADAHCRASVVPPPPPARRLHYIRGPPVWRRGAAPQLCDAAHGLHGRGALPRGGAAGGDGGQHPEWLHRLRRRRRCAAAKGRPAAAACGSELRRCALAAGAFLDLAADESRAWNRKACFLNYAPAAAAPQQRP